MSEAERIARLARAQRALAEVAKARHVTAVREHQEAEQEGRDIIGALSGDSPLHGIMVATMAGALKRNAVRTEDLRVEIEAAAAQRRREDVAADVLDERTRLARRREAAAAERRLAEELGAGWHLRRR